MADNYQSIIDAAQARTQKQLGDYMQNYRTSQTSFQQGQQASQSDFLNRYKSALGSLEPVPALAQRLGGELGLPGLQQTYQTATQAVQNLPRDTLDYARYGGTATPGGGGLNATQLQQLTQQKLYDLAPVAQRATEQYQNAQSLLAQRLGYETQQQERSLQPFQMEGSMLSDRLAREATGFQQQHEAELNGLIAQLDQQKTLTTAQLQRMNELANAENSYQHQLGLIGAQSQADINVKRAGFVPLTLGGSTTKGPISSAPTSNPPSSANNLQFGTQPAMNFLTALKSGGLR